MADTDMEEADQTSDQPKLGFGVLQFIKTAQSQHGLRHSDFKRYRFVASLSLQPYKRGSCLGQPNASVLAAFTTSRASGCRQYCTKKLHRSRRNLKMQQGKGKFTKKALELPHIETNAYAHKVLRLFNWRCLSLLGDSHAVFPLSSQKSCEAINEMDHSNENSILNL